VIPPLQQAILKRLAEVLELSEDIRFGQLIAFLPEFVATENYRPRLWDLEDEESLKALEIHLQQLQERQEQMAEPK
jgi:hypothetical protein